MHLEQHPKTPLPTVLPKATPAVSVLFSERQPKNFAKKQSRHADLQEAGDIADAILKGVAALQ